LELLSFSKGISIEKRGAQMGKIEESINIKCPVEKLFTYTTEAKNWPKWHRTIPEAEQTSQGQVSIGTTFRGKTRMIGQTSKWTAKLTEYQPFKRWGKIINSGSVIIDDKLIFDLVEGGTKFTMVYDVKVSGFLKLLSSLIISSLHKQLKIDVINLKSIMEAHA
jgi:hypothetical protein